MVKVILDAMGGDNAPESILDGLALSLEKGYVQTDELVLVGDESLLRSKMQERGLSESLQVVHAADTLTGAEAPVDAMRKKPNSSISVGIGLVKQGKGDAFVSAGSTGLVVASATLGLGTLEGIRRPGIAITIEGEQGPFMVMDVGANPQPKPLHLLHYAIMASAYFRDTYGKESPRVGLLNIGSEDQKGNSLTKEVTSLLRAAPLDFIGNVEGVEMFSGACEVVVCDGFTGNVVLKVSEGLAEYMLRTMARFMGEAKASPELMGKVIGGMQKRVDYSEHGGALLLGVKGIVTICHGRSEGPAISNAIRFAAGAVGAKVNEHIVNLAQKAAGSQ